MEERDFIPNFFHTQWVHNFEPRSFLNSIVIDERILKITMVLTVYDFGMYHTSWFIFGLLQSKTLKLRAIVLLLSIS